MRCLGGGAEPNRVTRRAIASPRRRKGAEPNRVSRRLGRAGRCADQADHQPRAEMAVNTTQTGTADRGVERARDCEKAALSWEGSRGFCRTVCLQERSGTVMGRHEKLLTRLVGLSRSA